MRWDTCQKNEHFHITYSLSRTLLASTRPTPPWSYLSHFFPPICRQHSFISLWKRGYSSLLGLQGMWQVLWRCRFGHRNTFSLLCLLTRPLPVFTAGREIQAGPQRAGSQLLCFYLSTLTVQLEKDVYLHYLQKLILDRLYCLPLHVNSTSTCISVGPWGPQKDDVFGWASVPVGEELLFGLKSVGFNMMENTLAVAVRSNICPVCKSAHVFRKGSWDETSLFGFPTNVETTALKNIFCLYILPFLGVFYLQSWECFPLPVFFSDRNVLCSYFLVNYYRSIN